MISCVKIEALTDVLKYLIINIKIAIQSTNQRLINDKNTLIWNQYTFFERLAYNLLRN